MPGWAHRGLGRDLCASRQFIPREGRRERAGEADSCHGPSQQQSGLRLDIKVPALRGGDSGVVILPGNSAQSKLIHRLAGSEFGLQMPPTGPVSAEEIGVLRAWIDQGAAWPDATVEETVAPEKAGPADPKGEPLFRAIRKRDLAAVRAISKRINPWSRSGVSAALRP